jgi:hypothetical protein
MMTSMKQEFLLFVNGWIIPTDFGDFFGDFGDFGDFFGDFGDFGDFFGDFFGDGWFM